jgi:hypothetical protein
VSRSKLVLAAFVVALLGVVPFVAAAAPNDGNGTAVAEETKSEPLKNTGGQTDVQVPAGTVSGAAAVCVYPLPVTNGELQTKAVTSVTPRFHDSTVWTNLECGSLSVSVPRGKRGLLAVRTGGEVTCTGPAVDQTQWCEGRVLVNGFQAHPAAQEADGSFAWAQSSPDVGAWEANSFSRFQTLSCPTTSLLPLCTWNVQVQVRNHAEGLSFRVDESTVETQVTYTP